MHVETWSKKKEKKNGIKNLFLYLLSFIPILISHHPECERFKAHVFNCKGIKLCVGCFIAYPTGSLALTLFFFINLDKILPPYLLLSLAFVFNASTLLSLTRLTRNRLVKSVQKGAIATGVAFLLIWIKAIPLSVPISTKISLSVIIIVIFLGLYNFKHVFTFLNTCYSCPFIFQWWRCPGFISIRKKWEQHGLTNLFASMEGFSMRMKERKEKGKKLLAISIFHSR
ncbi:MAG: hypothetical protein ACTSYC_10945 [Promethearchaeota archaeon]